MTLTVRFSIPITFAVPQQGLGLYNDDLLALANGRLVDAMPMSTANGGTWSYSERLVGLDPLDPALITVRSVPPVGAILSNFVVTGSTIHEFYSDAGVLMMRTEGSKGTPLAPVVVDPAHATSAFYKGGFALAGGGFAVITGVNSGGVSGSFLQRFAADGTALGPAVAVTSGLVERDGITALDETHFVMNWHSATDPARSFSQVFDMTGTATSAATEIRHYSVAGSTPLALSTGEFVEVVRSFHLGQPVISFQIHDASGAATTRFIDFATSTATSFVADSGTFQATALADGRFAVAWFTYDPIPGQAIEHVHLQIFDPTGEALSDDLTVGETDRFAEHVRMTTLADGRLALAWDFNSRRQIEYIDARSSGITLAGTSDSDAYTGSAYDDSIGGAQGSDRLNGGDGNDALTGGAGRDVLSGGAGDDRLAGDAGRDALTGGTGADVFVFAAKGGRDTVTDFIQGQDRIDLSAYHFASASAALAAFASGVFSDQGTEVTFTGFDTATLTAADLIL